MAKEPNRTQKPQKYLKQKYNINSKSVIEINVLEYAGIRLSNGAESRPKKKKQNKNAIHEFTQSIQNLTMIIMKLCVMIFSFIFGIMGILVVLFIFLSGIYYQRKWVSSAIRFIGEERKVDFNHL